MGESYICRKCELVQPLVPAIKCERCGTKWPLATDEELLEAGV